MRHLHPTIADEARWFVDAAQTPRRRSMREFAEAEIVIPSGDYAGHRYRCDRQPFTRLWFEEVDSGRWWEHWVTGPSQSSKTLSCCLIVLAYILFELRETVVFGVPDMRMARDKWLRDLLPVIQQTRYRELVPDVGAGSRGGFPDLLRFGNGAFLKFMGAGGGDKQRAGFATRHVVITELEEFGRSGETDESNKLEQLLARIRGTDKARARVYGESTVTTEDGITWSRYSSASSAQIALRCAHCGEWVIPVGTDDDRKLLMGWQDAPSDRAAYAGAHYACWHCGKAWSEQERHDANRRALVLHRGQRIENDRVVGELPDTVGLGFRWTGVHNCMVPPGNLALSEWHLAREKHEGHRDERLRAVRQFDWCIPHKPTTIDLSELRFDEVTARVGGTPQGVMPDDAERLTVFVDTGRYACWYLVLAARMDATATIIDYGTFELAAAQLGPEKSLEIGLREFADLCRRGWAHKGGLRAPNCVWIDSGYDAHTETVYRLCRDPQINPTLPWRWYPAKGFGAGQERAYRGATKTGAEVAFVGEQFQVRLLKEPGVFLVEINADHWKSRVAAALKLERTQRGALLLYQAMSGKHATIANHFTAEVLREKFVAGSGRGTGMVRYWDRIKRANHLLDCAAGAMAAAAFCGTRVIDEPQASAGSDVAGLRGPAAARRDAMRRPYDEPLRRLRERRGR